LSKEDYARLALEEGREVSFQIREHRILTPQGGPLPPELTTRLPEAPVLGGDI
jgi:hypothetical protein